MRKLSVNPSPSPKCHHKRLMEAILQLYNSDQARLTDGLTINVSPSCQMPSNLHGCQLELELLGGEPPSK